jgi:hypothetical protein
LFLFSFTDTETSDDGFKLKNLPKEEWEALAMKKHPNILALRERVRCINNNTTFGKIKTSGRTENKRILSPTAILQLIANHLYMIDKRESISILEEETGMNFIVDYDGFREESRLVTLLKLAKRNIPKGCKILDQDLSIFIYSFYFFLFIFFFLYF